MQPVMEPVFTTMATGDVLLQAAKKAGAAFARFSAPTYEAHLKQAWGAPLTGDDSAWRESLARGGNFAAAASPTVPTVPSSGAVVSVTLPGTSE